MFYKLSWVLRRVFYSLVNKQIHFYGYIGKPVSIIGFNSLRLKSRTRIFPGARLECYGAGSSIEIEENTSIGQNFHCTSGGALSIGEDTVISGNVCVTNIDHNYCDVGIPILDQSHIIRETKVGSNCFIGYGVILQAGTILGDQCIVGANSVVRGVFPSFSVIAGSPAKIIKKYNQEKDEWVRVK